MNRRKFILQSALSVAGVGVLGTIGCTPTRRFIAETAAEMDIPSGVSDFDFETWLDVLPDGQFRLHAPKMEMGQGIFTGFALMVAEELDVSPESIEVVPASSTRGPWDRAGTGGSSSTYSLYDPIREMAATLRESLKLAASKSWNIPIDQIKTENGFVISGGQKEAYHSIAARQTKWKIAPTPSLRSADQHQWIGKPYPRIDLQSKVMGAPIFGIDQTLPGMVFAEIVYSPIFGGEIQTLADESAKKIPGVLLIEKQPTWVAVVATKRYTAKKAVQALEMTWSSPREPFTEDIWKDRIKVGNGTQVSVQKDGRVRKALSAGPTLTAEYSTPLGAHAALEPSVCLADVQGDRVTLYISTQMAQIAQLQVSSATRFKTDNIEVVPTFIGGGFGRKATMFNAIEAVLLSDRLKKPVQVLWTRENEFQHGYVRPNTHHRLTAGWNAEKEITAMEHHQATGDMMLEYLPAIALKAMGADMFSAGHGARIPYEIPTKQATMWQDKLPFKTGIWRSVGMFSNTFAMESFLDELANQLQQDPVQLRLDLLKNTTDSVLIRRRNVLNKLSEAFGWKGPKPEGVGWGIACGEDRKSVAATAIEVGWKSGQFEVRRVVQVLDAGKIINPNGVHQQVEGATMMALSAAMFEEIPLGDNALGVQNFHQYPVIKLADTPRINVVLIEGLDRPYGVGEPPMAPVAPALANAIHDLTGKRIRSLPLLKENLLA